MALLCGMFESARLKPRRCPLAFANCDPDQYCRYHYAYNKQNHRSFGAEVTAGLVQVTFDPLEELLLADAALWAEHQLPVAGDRAPADVLIDADWLAGSIIHEVDLGKTEQLRNALPHLKARFDA